jgi:hypothetical protein
MDTDKYPCMRQIVCSYGYLLGGDDPVQISSEVI